MEKMDIMLERIESACEETSNDVITYTHADRSEKEYLDKVEESIEKLLMLIEMFKLIRENDMLKSKNKAT
jgi:archaellum component FlaC